MEDREPPHIPVAQAEKYAKFWIDPVALASNRGFRSHELTQIRRLVEQNRDFFLEKWEFIGRGIGIHWDEIDEDISVASVLRPEKFMRLADIRPARKKPRGR